ncbi:SDR family NAD(P)-dependent oxidoreductase [Microbacterium sp. C7(2022)]|uniref:SDR family NAD(P)-dependent oxidoreductase n=1 Tax=Microbacterium sp. C7(2022) TaxID=2992759 RepID=UPI00237AAC21|nr:SDR family NAD(P)-dependent oxidoreductase [Microbacterium sp. C7(2022)]MDE0545167.1 SDR family NAD(P)-dependent oxidoreductase [Microbacterium sp. C7(2022)]
MRTHPIDPVHGAMVLITGGARGMGELYARRAIAGGARAIALWDIDADAAEALATDLSRSGITVLAYAVDMGDLDSIRSTYAATARDLGDPDIIVNNAGVVRGAAFWDHDPVRDIENTLRINTLGAMWLTREALPAMMTDATRLKRILNIASAAGTLANPRMSVYAASKWAMIGWSESLRIELEQAGHRHIAVTTFCPSFVSTGMFAGARGPLWTPILSPREATAAAWNGMRRGTPMVLRPWTVKLGMAARGILPTRVWDAVAGPIFKVYRSMDHFTGRT